MVPGEVVGFFFFLAVLPDNLASAPTTVHMECSVDTRLVAAAGTLVNFAAAALFFP